VLVEVRQQLAGGRVRQKRRERTPGETIDFCRRCGGGPRTGQAPGSCHSGHVVVTVIRGANVRARTESYRDPFVPPTDAVTGRRVVTDCKCHIGFMLDHYTL
jgi:hypothetical protein